MKKHFFFLLILLLSSNAYAFNYGCKGPMAAAMANCAYNDSPYRAPLPESKEEYKLRGSKCFAEGDFIGCSFEDKILAKDRAGSIVVESVNEKGAIVVQEQTQICSTQFAEFQKQCDYADVQEAHKLIADIKQTIEERTSLLTNLNTEIGKPEFRSNQSVLSSMLDKAIELKKEIEAANVFLSEQKTFIETFTKNCNEQIQNVRAVCVEPTYSTVGDQVVIQKTTLTEQTSASVSAVGTSYSGPAEATVLVDIAGKFDAPEVRQDQTIANSNFNIAAHARREAVETWTATDSSVQSSSELAQQLIATLTPLVGRTTESNTVGCDELTGEGCSEAPATTPSDIMASRNAGDYSLGTPTDGSGTGGGTTAARAKTSAGGNGGGVSADQISADASSTAYGPTGVSGAGSPSGAAIGVGNGSATGGLGSVMGGLGSLSNVFGKTGGGFGTDSSYGSTRSNLRSGGGYGGSGSYKTSGNNNSNSNYNYRPGNKNLQNTTNSPDSNSPRSFGNNPQYNNGYGMPMGASGGNAGSGLSGSSGSSDSKEKPGFISRLLGRNKDKTLFGKRSSGGGSGFGGSFDKTSRSGFGSNSKMDSNNGKTTSNDNARVFDAKKYAPSKEAQDRAYARATGRKIASNSNDVSSASFEWPKDISTDKNGNLFRKAGLSVRVNLSK